MITEQDYRVIEHLDFEVEEDKDDKKVGHVYIIGDPGPAYCGVPRGQDVGHTCPPNSPLPKDINFCPHCGVKICPICVAVRNHLKRRGM